MTNHTGRVCETRLARGSRDLNGDFISDSLPFSLSIDYAHNLQLDIIKLQETKKRPAIVHKADHPDVLFLEFYGIDMK